MAAHGSVHQAVMRKRFAAENFPSVGYFLELQHRSSDMASTAVGYMAVTCLSTKCSLLRLGNYA